MFLYSLDSIRYLYGGCWFDTNHTRSNDNLSVFKNSQEEKIFKSTLLELTRITRIYCTYKAVVQFITTGKRTYRTVNAFNVLKKSKKVCLFLIFPPNCYKHAWKLWQQHDHNPLDQWHNSDKHHQADILTIKVKAIINNPQWNEEGGGQENNDTGRWGQMVHLL